MELFGTELRFPIGEGFKASIDWIDTNLDPVWELIYILINLMVTSLEDFLLLVPVPAMIIALMLIAWRAAGKSIAAFTLLAFIVIAGMDLWAETMQTLALVMVSTVVALGIGVPVGIMASRSSYLDNSLRPVLDFMQTLPAFVYLIPAILFFRIGRVPGIIATVIFAMPPAIRLTNLGIRQVSEEVVEAAKAFGSTSNQLLAKVQLPMAMPTIMAGVNQSIMLALSMVVIASMVGAPGLGAEVLRGITQLNIAVGFEGGLAVVLLAMFLDRVTEALGKSRHRR